MLYAEYRCMQYAENRAMSFKMCFEMCQWKFMSISVVQVLISYYQWVPLILLFQGLLAFVPCLFWRFINKRSGINMAAIMDAARHSSQAHYLEIREKVRY